MNCVLSPEQEAKVLALVRQIPRSSVSISALLARVDLLLSVCEVVDHRFARCRYCGGFPLFAVACSQNTTFLCALCALERAHRCPCTPGCSPNALPACSWPSDLREFVRFDGDAVAVQHPLTVTGVRGDPTQLAIRDAIQCVKCNRREVTLFAEQRMCSVCFHEERRRLVAVAREEDRASKRPRSPSTVDERLTNLKRPATAATTLPAAVVLPPANRADTSAAFFAATTATTDHSVPRPPPGSIAATAENRRTAGDSKETPPAVDRVAHDISVNPLRERDMLLVQTITVPAGVYSVPPIVAQIIASKPMNIEDRNRLAGMSGTGLIALRFRNAPPPTSDQVVKQLDSLRCTNSASTVTSYLGRVCVGALLLHFRAQLAAKKTACNWKLEVIRRQWTSEPSKVFALGKLIEAHPRCELIDVRRYPWRQWRDHISVLHREFDRLRKDATKYEHWR